MQHDDKSITKKKKSEKVKSSFGAAAESSSGFYILAIQRTFALLHFRSWRGEMKENWDFHNAKYEPIYLPRVNQTTVLLTLKEIVTNKLVVSIE